MPEGHPQISSRGMGAEVLRKFCGKSKNPYRLFRCLSLHFGTLEASRKLTL
jgi:hypothetical protein